MIKQMMERIGDTEVFFDSLKMEFFMDAIIKGKSVRIKSGSFKGLTTKFRNLTKRGIGELMYVGYGICFSTAYKFNAIVRGSTVYQLNEDGSLSKAARWHTFKVNEKILKRLEELKKKHSELDDEWSELEHKLIEVNVNDYKI